MYKFLVVILFSACVIINNKLAYANRCLDNSFMCGSSLSDRIIGGKNAALGQYPWIARLGYKNKLNHHKLEFGCGGALINCCYVLTAAHCVVNIPQDSKLTTIVLGEHNERTVIDCEKNICADPLQKFHPQNFTVHRDYGNPNLKNDIALIKLDRPINLTKWVMPICLPSAELLTKSLSGTFGEVAGWGTINIRTNEASKILQTVVLPIRSVDYCKYIYRGKAEIDIKQMCVGGVQGFDSCGGDSGGPLMKVDALIGKPPKYFAFGIVSFGPKACGRSIPAIYTNISHYINWIHENINPC